jgi:hypothetical protein
MKSILAKQAPHKSPWLPMRVRQEMQTGGKSRSARWPSSERSGLRPAAPAAREAGLSELSSTPMTVMDTIIEPGEAALEVRSGFTP